MGMVVPSLDRDGHGEEEEEEGDADAEAEAAPGALLALLLRDDGLGHSSAGWPETSALIPISTSLFEQYSTERRPEMMMTAGWLWLGRGRETEREREDA